jgi:putative oxidoreductase
MVFGVVTHLLIIGGNPLPAIVLATLSSFVAYRLRPPRVVFLPAYLQDRE